MGVAQVTSKKSLVNFLEFDTTFLVPNVGAINPINHDHVYQPYYSH
jgi:hypothetical protein